MIFYIMCGIILIALPVFFFVIFVLSGVYYVPAEQSVLFFLTGVLSWTAMLLAGCYKNHRKKFMIISGIFFIIGIFIYVNSPELKNAYVADTCVDLGNVWDSERNICVTDEDEAWELYYRKHPEQARITE